MDETSAQIQEAIDGQVKKRIEEVKAHCAGQVLAATRTASKKAEVAKSGRRTMGPPKGSWL